MEANMTHVPDTPQGLTVSLNLLDTLMNLAGELVLSRNQLLQGISAANMKIIEQSGQRIDMITSELQDVIMRTRMQPISGLFDQCARRIQDLAGQEKKSVSLTLEGREVELDKTILESIAAPLAALCESCVTHGIEPPSQRLAQGKAEAATITLRAFHDAGQVHIDLIDDGSGQSHETSAPEFRQQIEALGGIPEFDATPGQGARARIKLPLTLAIIPSQIASVGKERYAIPQSNLGELIRIPAAEARERIETVGNAEVVRLRDELLPLVNLSQMLAIPTFYHDPDTGRKLPERRISLSDRRGAKYEPDGSPKALPEEKPDHLWQERTGEDRRSPGSSAINIAVVFAGPFKYGLVIDQLHDAEEIVVKPVGRHLRENLAFSGATIMGDGRVALILDILNIAQMADLSSDTGAVGTAEAAASTDTGSDLSELVIFKNGDTEYFAAPLASVQRIEKLDTSRIETMGTQKVIQYRGGSLPVFELSQALDVRPLPRKAAQELIVFKVQEQEFGIMVSPPVDTVGQSLGDLDAKLARPGVPGSLVIHGKTTLLLDLEALRGLLF